MSEVHVSFKISIPVSSGVPLNLTLDEGQALFLLGPNGAGKSSLMHDIYRAHRSKARRISAHRQTWFASNSIDISPHDKRQSEHNLMELDTHADARWKEYNAQQRASLAIYDLVDAENVRARSITNALDRGSSELAQERLKKDSPIKIINELLRLSNIPIQISIHESDQVVASKSGSQPYSAAELSDGERNALLLSTNVLTAKEGTLILIDEPERHLHRSIISSLLPLLFAKRLDCAFVISTHDVMLPSNNRNGRTILIRACHHSGGSIKTYEADPIAAEEGIDDEVRTDILGARRKIIFVEGTDQSIDKPLYSLLFPNVSIVAKASCRDVQHAVSSIRDAHAFHWLRAFGIVDSDGRTQNDLARLKAKGIYAISAFSVESIYYHPEVQRRVVERHAAVTGGNASTRLENAKTAATAARTPHIQRLSERVAEKVLREMVLVQLPKRQDLGNPVNITINSASVVADERSRFERLLQEADLIGVICRYPIRETPVLAQIAKNLGFQDREQYESAVRKLMLDDEEALTFVRAFFGTLETDIAAP